VTYLVVASAAGITHWAQRGFTKTLCGLNRNVWRYLDKPRPVTCVSCRTQKARRETS
jgi:hypothetical protein